MTEAVFAAEPTRLLIAALIRAAVGAAVVAMTMAAGIMAAMPGVAELSPVYLAAIVCAINGGAPANVAVAASLLFYIIHREISSPLPSSLYGDTRIIHKMQKAV